MASKQLMFVVNPLTNPQEACLTSEAGAVTVANVPSAACTGLMSACN